MGDIMYIQNIPRYLRGYVKFQINTNSAPEFLSYCSKNNINLFDTKIINDTLVSSCLVYDYRKMNNVKIKGLKKKILKRKGLRFFTNKYKKRIGLFTGFILMIFLLFFLSGYIWQIDITGNERLSDNLILETLNECGFSKGKSKSKLNISEIENTMMMKLVDLSRISINLDGSYANIIVKERQMPPASEDKSKPSNLVASMDGIITKMEIVKGKPMALVGSGVSKGQLLVSGLYNDKKDNIILEHSSGRVTALVEISKTFSLSYNSKKVIGLKQKHYYSIDFFEKIIDISFAKEPNSNEWVKTENKTRLSILGLNFPLYLIDKKYEKEIFEDSILSSEQAKKRVMDEIKHFEAKEFSDGNIVKKHITWKSDDKKCIAQVDYEVLLNIAKQQYIDN